MLEAMQSALVGLLQIQHLSYMLLGVLVGLTIGFLPGLGGISGMSLLIPFVYGMDQVSAIAMLIGMIAVIPTGDTFTSILMGIPGSSASQATVVDGFPLAKRGQAARALSAAFSASMLGGIFGALLLSLFVVVAKPVILTFTSAELFMLAILGLSMVGVLSGNSIVRGVGACGLGAMFGAIGAAPATGENRFDLGIAYLADGIPLVIIGLGMFAIPELADLIRRHRPIAERNEMGSGWGQGIRDTLKHWTLVLRSSTIGTIVGALPGLGGSVVDWITYGITVQTAKDKSQFGKGDIRGVIAPEAANNALQGGALMPTLLFGIPGSGSMAVFLGGMVLLGIQSGPNMVTTDLNVTYTIAWTLAIASILGSLICFFFAYPISRLTFIPFNLVAPFMVMIICFAAFQTRRNLMDLLLLVLVGVLGILLRRFGWSRPAFLIGFVLAEPIENYLYQALQFNGWAFLTRPGVLIIMALIVISVWAGTRVKASEQGVLAAASGGGSGSVPVASDPVTGSSGAGLRPAAEAPPQIPSGSERLPQLLFALLLLAIFAYGAASSYGLSFLGAVFPMSTSLLMITFVGYAVWKILRPGASKSALFDQVMTDRASGEDDGRGIWRSAFWFVLLMVMTALFGFILALAIFVIAFLRLRAELSIAKTLIYCATCVIFMMFLGHMLTLDFPAGLLQSMVELPWPLR
jgi:putative tricarboxylic transport membrane protein